MAETTRPLPADVTDQPGITPEELQLATRNHGMPLEALRWPVTPTGLHYLLIHYDIPLVDPAAWRLEIGRAVSQPRLLEAVGTSEWTGTPLWPLLEEAGIEPGAAEVVFTGLDEGVEGGVEQRYARSLPLAEARREEVMLVWGMNGAPLPPQHGFPLRLLVPGWYGMTSVKWLSVISVSTERFRGYQQERAYRWRSTPEEPGE